MYVYLLFISFFALALFGAEPSICRPLGRLPSFRSRAHERALEMGRDLILGTTSEVPTLFQESAGIRLRMQNGRNSRGIACLTPTVFFACFSLVDKLPDILVAGVRSLPCKYKEPLKRPELNILKKITLQGGRLHLFMFHPMFMCPPSSLTRFKRFRV